MSDDCCGNCYYGRKRGEALTCRRYAPTGSNVREDRALAGVPWLAVWPAVAAYDWCGDWRERDVREVKA